MAYYFVTESVPFKSKDSLKNAAETFRTSNQEIIFPVDIEAICDKISVNIIPIDNLANLLSGIDAFITSDFKNIYVDGKGYDKNSARYRFSVAHELGHLILHKKYYPDGITNFESYLKLAPRIRNERPEFQANYFAANLLAPDKEISEILCEYLGEDPEGNFWKVGQEKQAQIIRQLCKKLGISEQTAILRIKDVYPKIFDSF